MNDIRQGLSRRRLLKAGGNLAVAVSAAGIAGCPDEEAMPPPTSPPPPAGPPNIVLFLIDDLGARDCGHCGSRYYRTLNLDRVAAEGIRYTQAYSPSPLCSSSRAAILTGKYPHRLGITGAIWCPPGCTPITQPRVPASAPAWQKAVTPDFLTQLPPAETTLAEMLRAAGYATAHIGKWHLGGSGEGPAQQGFEFVIGGGNEAAPADYFSPWGLAGMPPVPAGEYLTDHLTHWAREFVVAQQARPFFLSLSHYGVHMPLQAPADLVTRYVALRDASAAQRNESYAAMIESVDASLGALLAELQARGLADNTLLIVTSDNGGLIQAYRDPLLRRVTSNGPFRGGKSQIHEGGIRVPLLLRWPQRIAAGGVHASPVCGIDILPTALAAAGLPPAAGIDGISLAETWSNGTALAARALAWHFPHYMPLREAGGMQVEEHEFKSLPSSALRVGQYKIIRIYGEGEGGEPRHELYDLDADEGEQVDLAPALPARVSELAAQLDANLAETGALLPRANPAYSATLDGWRGNAWVKTAMGHGVLRAEGTGNWPALQHALMLSEDAVCRVRLRSLRAARITLFYSTQTAGGFSAAQSVGFDVNAGSAFSEQDFPVPATTAAPVRTLQLRVGSVGDVIEIDSIRLLAATEPARELRHSRFSGVSGLAYGGSWFAENDTFVSCGPGSLQIDMAGPAPVIVSPPLTLHGPLRVRWRMRSSGGGEGALAWSMTFAGAATSPRRVPVALIHDGNWHDYDVMLPELSDAPVQRIALALGNAVGAAEIDVIRILDGNGSLLSIWEFCAPD